MSEKKQTSEYRAEWTMTVLKLIYSRRNHLNEVLRITKELSDSLERNDRVSVQMLLEMRGQELEEIDNHIRRLQLFKEQLPEETHSEIDALLQGKQPQEQDQNSLKIVEAVKACKKILEEIVMIDKRMSKRIAGSDSFYG